MNAANEGRLPVSACIITLQEAEHIGDCIRSVAWCDDIVVVDSGSSDATIELARELGARVVSSEWLGFTEQKNLAVSHAQNDWVLCIDADERVSEPLRQSIDALFTVGASRENTGPAGFEFARCTMFAGRWIRHGGWYPDRQLRLFDRRRGRWTGGLVHEKVTLDGEVERLDGELLHYAYDDIADNMETVNRYTSLMAADLIERDKSCGVHNLVLNPTTKFLKYYFFKLGFLDGWRGLVIAATSGFYTFLKYAKALEIRRTDSNANDSN